MCPAIMVDEWTKNIIEWTNNEGYYYRHDVRIKLTRGEPFGVTVQECSTLTREDDWGGLPAKHQKLHMVFINIQSFPSYVVHQKNDSIICMINANYIDCLGMAEMKNYWPAHSNSQQIQEQTEEKFETTVLAATYNQQNIMIQKQPGGCAAVINDK